MNINPTGGPSDTSIAYCDPWNSNQTALTYTYPPVDYSYLSHYANVIKTLRKVVRDSNLPESLRERAEQKLEKYLELL